MTNLSHVVCMGGPWVVTTGCPGELFDDHCGWLGKLPRTVGPLKYTRGALRTPLVPLKGGPKSSWRDFSSATQNSGYGGRREDFILAHVERDAR